MKWFRYLGIFVLSGVFWLGIVWLALDQFGVFDMRPTASEEDQAAVTTLEVSMAIDHEQAFFRMVRDFATEQEFAVRAGTDNRSGDISVVDGWQHGLNFIAVASSDPGRYNVSFFRVCNAPVPETYINRLARDLSKRIDKIDGARTRIKG